MRGSFGKWSKMFMSVNSDARASFITWLVAASGTAVVAAVAGQSRLTRETPTFRPYLAKNRAKNAHIPVYAALFRTIFCQIGTKIERFA